MVALAMELGQWKHLSELHFLRGPGPQSSSSTGAESATQDQGGQAKASRGMVSAAQSASAAKA
eukprot:3510110-Lingulodinium_polyedra.AAC.1